MEEEVMKIAILSFYSGEVSRGVETYVHELGNNLIELGHEIVIFQNGLARKDAKYETQVIGLPINWDTQNKGLPFVNYWALLIKKFTEQSLQKVTKDTQIVITTNGQWQSVLARKWSRKNNVKHIIVGQSGPGLDDRINLVTTPDSFIAFTESQCDWARTAVPFIKTRINKIPNAVDLKRFSKVKKFRIDLPGPIYLNVAALQEFKRQELAIRAVSKLNKGSLLIVGKGGLKKDLENLAEELLPGRHMVAEYPYEDMPSVYAVANVFTYPTSPWESFGIVMLEAMASGLPVVATDDPIRKEIVGNAGILVNPENVDMYSKALEKASKTKWGNKPLEQAKKYSWENIAKQYEELFNDLTK
jgi:glycosyltransferase involved in cell wall biosynthesis